MNQRTSWDAMATARLAGFDGVITRPPKSSNPSSCSAASLICMSRRSLAATAFFAPETSARAGNQLLHTAQPENQQPRYFPTQRLYPWWARAVIYCDPGRR
jgi:hypothetical protein